MIHSDDVAGILRALDISHVVWVPDSFLGRWEQAIERTATRLIRVCREGEAWPLAAGLIVAGARPLVMMQTTGLFESGDALRNVAHDLQVPVYGWIGVRNWLHPDSSDSARRFAPAIVDAWQVEQTWILSREDLPKLEHHYLHCRQAGRFGLALIAEGAG